MKVITDYANRHGLAYLDVEATYNESRTALCHLLFSEHYEPHQRIQGLVARIRELNEQLGESGYFSKEKQEKLDKLMEEIVFYARRDFGTKLSHENIAAFCEIAEAGRALFIEQRYEPDEFISTVLLRLGQLVRDNFDAYDATLNDRLSDNRAA